MEKRAVQWFDEQLQDKMYVQYGYSDGVRKIVIPIEDYMKLKQQALQMEREQHGKTWDTALDKYEVRAGNYMRAYEDFDDYYEHIVDAKKMVNKPQIILGEHTIQMFTISDDVLFEQATVAMEEVYGYGCETEIDAYFRGAKWILKQTNK